MQPLYQLTHAFSPPAVLAKLIKANDNGGNDDDGDDDGGDGDGDGDGDGSNVAMKI